MFYMKNVLNWISVCVLCHVVGIFAGTRKEVRTNNIGTCTTPLLKEISGSSFSASSVLRNESEFGPQQAIEDSFYGLSSARTAWCPDKAVSNPSTEWLQVDFDSTKIISIVITRGQDNGNYGEYVENYYFDYQRDNGMSWYRYRDGDRTELIKGNIDPRNMAEKKLETPLVAKRIRIIPIGISTPPKRVCLKLVLYGCNFSDGVLEYRMPRGNNLIQDQHSMSFDDDRYDGGRYSNTTWLIGGMGKLMDNVVPINTSSQIEIQKYVVAWNRSLQRSTSVDLLFRFDSIRSFRSITLHQAVVPALDIRSILKGEVEMYSGESGLGSRPMTVKEFQIEENNEDRIHVLLENSVAGFIKVRLFFRSQWMGLTEVVFDSNPAMIGTQPSQPLSPPEYQSPTISPLDRSSKLLLHITLISCFIGAFILVSVLTVICFFWVRQRNRRRYKSKLSDYRTILLNESGYPSNVSHINTIYGKNPPMLFGGSDPSVFGPNTTSTLGFRYIIPSYPCSQEYRVHSSTNSNEYEPIDSYWPRPPQQNGGLVKDAALDQVDRQTLLCPVAGPDITHHTNGVVIDSGSMPIYGSGSAYSHPYDNSLTVPDIIPLPTVVTQDTFTDIYNRHITNPLQGLLGSTMTSCHTKQVSAQWLESALARLSEISQTSLVPQKHVSEGDLGHISSGLVKDCSTGVIVATFKRAKPNSEIQYAFYKQCLITIKDDFTSHPNLLPLVGRSNNDSPCPSVMYAYPSQVNVVTFFYKLRQIPRPTDVSFTCSYVSQNSLLHLSKQLADALAFLDECSVLHRDVSARNCSIGDGFHLILSDFALGLEEFQDDYVSFCPPKFQSIKDSGYFTRTVQLPLLWMSWEAIMMGQYTTMSDVWSFGVTLWEIFTECQLKPYSTALPVANGDPSVMLRNCLLLASSQPSAILPNGRSLDQSHLTLACHTSTDISRHVRDISLLCWQPDAALRPSFQTIYSLLAELSPDLGYVDEYGTLHRLIS